MPAKITIIGAGLTGLTLAYLLKKENIDCELLEARNRLGGRIFTKMSGNHIPIDLGAAWFWDYNPQLKGLLAELNLGTFPQVMGNKVWYQQQPSTAFQQIQIPDPEQISYRIKGGSTNLILSLAAQLDPDQIKLETKVTKITRKFSKYTIETSQGVIDTDLIISTLPPALNTSIEFDPELPEEYLNTANDTHTWMQDSIKFGLGFKIAFWKELNVPVTAFSNFAAVSEMYDYSNMTGDRFAIMGFLNPQLSSMHKEKRKVKVLEQLSQFLGKPVSDYVSYEECAWNEEPFTKKENSKSLPPHHNNGNPMLRSYFNKNTLIMAGSETSFILPGYMEGAVNSAQETFDLVMQII